MLHESAGACEQRAQRALDSSPIHDLHGLNVHHTGESILIPGVVSSFYHQQLVQEIVRAAVDGVVVVNSVVVR
jgi:hypothetical protein